MGRHIVLATLIVAMALTATTSAAKPPPFSQPGSTAAAKARGQLLTGDPCLDACDASFQEAVDFCDLLFPVADLPAEHMVCINDATNSRAECRALCGPPPTCQQACEATHQDAVAACTSTFDPAANCPADDPVCIADFIALRAGCIRDADYSFLQCLVNCGTISTDQHTWGQLKTIYR